MPTKFPRKRCTCCGTRHVAWKMPTMVDPQKSRRIFFCWPCSQAFFEKLVEINITDPPNKRALLAYAKKKFQEAQLAKEKEL